MQMTKSCLTHVIAVTKLEVQEGDKCVFWVAAHVNWTKSCMDMVTCACVDGSRGTNGKNSGLGTKQSVSSSHQLMALMN